MNEQQERQQQEYEFVMEGITTRMQMAMSQIVESNKNALEKMSESNRLSRNTVRHVCIVMLAVIIIVISGFIINNSIWIKHVNNLRNQMVVSEEVPDAKIPQFGSGTNDR